MASCRRGRSLRLAANGSTLQKGVAGRTLQGIRNGAPVRPPEHATDPDRSVSMRTAATGTPPSYWRRIQRRCPTDARPQPRFGWRHSSHRWHRPQPPLAAGVPCPARGLGNQGRKAPSSLRRSALRPRRLSSVFLSRVPTVRICPRARRSLSWDTVPDLRCYELALVASTARADPKADNGFLDRCSIAVITSLTCRFARRSSASCCSVWVGDRHQRDPSVY